MKREFLALFLLATGCGQSANQNSELNAQWHDQSGYDITVLQSWIAGTVALQIGTPQMGDINPDKCNMVSSTAATTGSSSRKIVDCRSAVEEAKKLAGASTVSPMISPATHEYIEMHDTGARYTQNGQCELLEFRTVIRDVALAADSFNGVGFYLAGSMQSDLPHAFVPKSRLHVVGHVTMKDGAPATVHRFIAQGMCFGLGGNGGSVAYRQYKFRPFAEFKSVENGEEHFYRQWDSVASEYLLGRKRDGMANDFVRDFDRQDELLQK